MLGVVITRINTIVDQRFASSLVVGSIAALTFATRLMDLPLGVFGVAISTVIFPLLSKLAIKEENREEFKLTLKKGSLLVFFITIPAAVGLIVLGKVLISLLFQHGRFTYENTLMAYKALIFYSIGLPFFAAIHTVTRAFYALQDTKTPIKIGAFIVGFNIILNYFLIKTVLNYSGLALATSVCAIINFFTLTYFLKRKINILWSQTFFSIAKMFLSAILMGALTYLLLNNVLTFKAPYDFNNFVTILKGFFKIILNILLSVCFYFICSYFICPEGISITKEIISKRKINN